MSSNDPAGAEPGIQRAMGQAIAAAARVRRTTAPNPWVGAVVLRDGVVVAEGATQPPGGAHAEVVALQAAGRAAAGATVVVTLEPCAHTGRTGPCADALIDAGVARVVVGLEDPDPRVAGQGAARLRAAGIDVVTGVAADEVRAQLAAYLHHRRSGRSACTLKLATSIDGRIAAQDGSSQWITGAAARADAHELRADCQAVMVGSGTALADDPALTVRDVDPSGAPPGEPPLRVLLDARGRVRAEGRLFVDCALTPTLVVTTAAAPDRRVQEWVAAGAKVERVGAGPDGGVDLAAVLTLLGARGVLDTLAEGGSALHAALLRAGLVQRAVVYVGNTVLGAQALPAFADAGPAGIAQAPRWALRSARAIDADVRLEYAVGA